MKTVVDRGKDRKDGRDLEKQETGIQRRKSEKYRRTGIQSPRGTGKQKEKEKQSSEGHRSA